MNKLTILTIALFSVVMLNSCDQARTSDPENASGSETTQKEQEKESQQEETKVEQTIDERIVEIKQLYSAIQKAQKKESACTSKSKTTYDGLEEKYPFENTAKQCQLEDDLMYQQVQLNGHEWSETCSFYYKDNALFFAFLSGGAEACGYDYRVYYNKDGEVIKVLSAENDCDGNEVSSSKDVTANSKKKEEILKSIAIAKAECKSILGR